jgi:carotenoid cleavage dioxygenase
VQLNVFYLVYSWSYSADVERMKAGGHHWIYDPDQPIRFAVVPRDLHDKSEVKWFEWGHGQPGHIASGWEENHGKTM